VKLVFGIDFVGIIFVLGLSAETHLLVKIFLALMGVLLACHLFPFLLVSSLAITILLSINPGIPARIIFAHSQPRVIANAPKFDRLLRIVFRLGISVALPTAYDIVNI
jgi:hypothetical protein